ncbi:MAG: CBS domain-containing protein [Burkholderiales bacterium]|nr:CBS domain-containing protein [Burkholderiales bacterium]
MQNEKLQLKSVQCDRLPIPGADPWYANEADPALLAMIDFRSRPSVTLQEEDIIDEALKHLKHAGVRCAFVVDKKKNSVVGMLTAYDISGEKSQQYMHFTGVGRKDVRVGDIMQKIKDWRVADIKDIERSTVGDVLELFKDTGVTHLPVMETTQGSEECLRGLLSYAKVKRLLAK